MASWKYTQISSYENQQLLAVFENNSIFIVTLSL